MPTPRWATFTYTGKETYLITKLFNKANIKISFRTNNYILTTLERKKGNSLLINMPRLRESIHQTNRKKDFTTRFKEHRNTFKTANQSNSFTKHLTDNLHHFGRMQETMTILHLQNKGMHLNTIERFYIYAEHKKQNHLNDDSTIFPNKIFETLIKPNPAIAPPPPPTS
jgi:hypothetical protein